jgi:hypothetical protein
MHTNIYIVYIFEIFFDPQKETEEIFISELTMNEIIDSKAIAVVIEI